ncbi:hypothetical protein QBC43DRAFT_283461 [Cladorrhinum sp. PSN259]|nr:hypothetical protein QBC43DRAFT_283461 [Cladorrhinum sp. PSN259]
METAKCAPRSTALAAQWLIYGGTIIDPISDGQYGWDWAFRPFAESVREGECHLTGSLYDYQNNGAVFTEWTSRETGRGIGSTIWFAGGSFMQLPEEAVTEGSGNLLYCHWHGMMKLLLERDKNLVVSENVVKAAAGNAGIGWKDIMLLLLERRGKGLKIPEAVLKVHMTLPRMDMVVISCNFWNTTKSCHSCCSGIPESLPL